MTGFDACLGQVLDLREHAIYFLVFFHDHADVIDSETLIESVDLRHGQAEASPDRLDEEFMPFILHILDKLPFDNLKHFLGLLMRLLRPNFCFMLVVFRIQVLEVTMQAEISLLTGQPYSGLLPLDDLFLIQAERIC